MTNVELQEVSIPESDPIGIFLKSYLPKSPEESFFIFFFQAVVSLNIPKEHQYELTIFPSLLWKYIRNTTKPKITNFPIFFVLTINTRA